MGPAGRLGGWVAGREAGRVDWDGGAWLGDWLGGWLGGWEAGKVAGR